MSHQQTGCKNQFVPAAQRVTGRRDFIQQNAGQQRAPAQPLPRRGRFLSAETSFVEIDAPDFHSGLSSHNFRNRLLKNCQRLFNLRRSDIEGRNPADGVIPRAAGQ